MLHRLVSFATLAMLGAVTAAQMPAAKPVASHRSTVKRPAGKEIPPSQPVPIPQMTPEQLPPQPPRVSYRNGQLTVDSQNSTLSDILTAIRRQTGAQFELPAGVGGERVAVHLSGPPCNVISGLLDGSNFGYIILGSADNPLAVQKVILTVLPKGPPPPNTATAGNRPFSPAPNESAGQDYSPDEDQPEVVNDRNPMPPDQNAPPQPGLPGQPAQMIPGQAVPGQPMPGQPMPAGQGPNPYVGGEQPRFGQPTQIAPNPNEPQNPGAQVKTPEQLLQELQRMRNQQQNPNQPQPDQE